MTKQLNTYKSLADFEALGKRIRSAAHTPFNLVQDGLVAAFLHLEAHGNVNVLSPIVSAIEDTFRNRGMVNRVRAYILKYTWLEYNARGLKGTQLRDAQFDVIWTKNKARKMDIDGARAVKWFEMDIPRNTRDRKVNATAEVARIFKRLQEMLNEHQLRNQAGGAITVGDLRTEIRTAMESLTAPKVTIVTKKAAPKKAAKKAPAKAKATKAKVTTPVAKAA